MSSLFDSFEQEVNDGLAGRNAGIPMGFTRLNNYVSIRKANNYLIGGYTGSGKTSLIDDAFVLNPVDYYLRHNKSDLHLKIVYYSMERRKNFKFAKWISRRIFLDTGNIIPVTRMMGWVNKEQRLTKDEHDLIKAHRDYIEGILSVVTIMDMPENPTGMRKYMHQLALANGKIEEVDEYHKVYVANKPGTIILKIKDHLGLIKREKILPTKKEIIDKASEDDRFERDFFGFSAVNISQFNRDISNPMRIKNGEVEPMMEDFKDSGNTQEDADVVLSLFDPFRYKVVDPSGYDLTKLRDEHGRKKYRSLKILKNSYGSDDIRIGLAFQPEVGMFKELPKVSDTTEEIYNDIKNNTYFLPEYNKR